MLREGCEWRPAGPLQRQRRLDFATEFLATPLSEFYPPWIYDRAVTVDKVFFFTQKTSVGGSKNIQEGH